METVGKESGKFISATLRLEVDHVKTQIVQYVRDAWDSELEPAIGGAIAECLRTYQVNMKSEIERQTRRVMDEMLANAVKEAITNNWNLRFEIEDRIKKMAAKVLQDEFLK